MGPRSRRSTRSTRGVFAPGGRVRRWLLPGQGWWRIRCGPPRSVWVGGRSWTGSGWTRCCRGSCTRTGGGAPRRSPRTWTAPSSQTVLRTLHDHGIPVRRGGPPPRRTPDVGPRLTALSSDPEITALLRRHRIPRRHRPGGITDRFPTPARITGVPARRVPGHRAGRGAHRATHRTPRRTGPGPTAPAPQAPHPGPARRRPLPLGAAGITTTYDDPPQTTPSHRSQGSTAAGCRRRPGPHTPGQRPANRGTAVSPIAGPRHRTAVVPDG